MARDRRGKAVLLLAATALVLAGLWALGASLEPAPGGALEAGLVVVEPGGSVVYEGVVTPGNATALGVLDAGADDGGFPYETETHGMGVQVVSINGTRNEGSSGWVYRVRSEGEWCWGDRSPDRYAVGEGDRVRWEWSEEAPGGGCEPADGGS